MGKATKFYNKTKRKGLLSAIVGGIMTAAGIVFLILPLAIVSGVDGMVRNLIFLGAGAVLLISGFCLLISGLTQWLVRPYAVVFTDEGLFDFTGKHKNGMFIEWNNIKDARIYGKGEAAFIGIDLISLDMAYKNISSKQKREICENISNNMPAVIINQYEITEPIGSVVKSILQIRLGTKADMFKMEELENDVNNVVLPTFSKEEPDEPSKTGDTDLPSEKKEVKEPEVVIQETVTKKEPVPEETEEVSEEELKKLDTAEINISSTEMAKKMSETASIDDLLAMLSIGDDK
ncbi:MAG: hypothetical protein J6Q24_02690 [Clostridia bacterium]|nr:hypothetical protein [Clostridia bacterium]